LSVAEVVVEADAVVVVACAAVVEVDDEVDDEEEEPDELAVVVVVVADAGGATNGFVSPFRLVRVAVGVTDRLVHPLAAFQLWTAAAAGAPVSGCGRPATMVAGRNTAPVMWRPSAVMISEPLFVSGGLVS
jgi:hypothetical protein